MHTESSHAQVDELTGERCEQLLAQRHHGRVGFTAWGETFIFPVSYVFWTGQVVFRTSVDGVLARLRNRTQVAFEIDEVDPVAGSAWDVLVRGPSAEVTNRWQTGEIWSNPELVPWMPDLRPLIIAIEPASITGRRLTFARRTGE